MSHLANNLSKSLQNSLGAEMVSFVAELFPICRSITGDGVRKSLEIIRKHIPLLIHEVPSGTQVFDWVVPQEWNIKEAYIKDSQGNTILDVRNHSLHILNYSSPVKGKFKLSELKDHLFSDPEKPEVIPYRTSYYQENWGFCMTHKQYEALEDDTYEVCIDTTLAPGYLTYGEFYIPGESQEEVLISAHNCHPSLANDNLSGVAVATFLAKYLVDLPYRKFSYRFVFGPATIGAITWLSLNQDQLDRIRHGLILSLLGAPGTYVYKNSRRENTEINEVFQYVLNQWKNSGEIDDFIPYGYDERQYCSPGFNLPVGSLSKGRWGEFPEYHTSADNLDFISAEELGDSLALLIEALFLLETNETYENLNPHCEPQLGKRGLFESISGSNMNQKHFSMALLWILNSSDGSKSLVEIAKQSGLPYRLVHEAANALVAHNLLRPAIVQHSIGELTSNYTF
ncbi:MAG: DUF4910 domain-containing protein [Bacteroidota bacterium]